MANQITLTKGDSSNYGDLRTIEITLDTTLDLTGQTGEFVLQDSRKQFIIPESKVISLVFDTYETQNFALGSCYGILRLWDSDRRIRTFASQIPFEIVDTVVCNEDEPWTLSCTIDSTPVNITVQSFFDYENLENKPQINGVTLSGDQTGAEIGLADSVDGEFTLSNFSEKTTFDASNYTMQDLANLVCTLIEKLGG